MKRLSFGALGLTALLVVMTMLDLAPGATGKTLIAAGFFAVSAIVFAILAKTDIEDDRR